MALHRLANGRAYGTSVPDGYRTSSGRPVRDDPRVHLPTAERDAVLTELPDGTLYTDWRDPPLDQDERPPIELPSELPEEGQTWRADKPRPPKSADTQEWYGAGPLPHRLD